MLYMITWTFAAGNTRAVNDRFLKTGGTPPEGAKMVGRWIRLDNGGFALCETDDPLTVTKWLLDWNDLIDFEVHPVVTDEQYASAISP